ncbi:MAG TPA: hypothetical protein VIT23_05870 [Terrimicrobiaceae bacterium]
MTAYAQPKPLLYLPGSAKLTIKALHEDGTPVVGAKVGVGFNQTQNYWHEGHKFDMKELITDSRGSIVASGETTSGWVTYGATKKGYYRTSGERLILDRRGNRYEPWNSIKELVLKPILRPIPMYVRKIEMLSIPDTGKPIGFDLVTSDWVSPYGTGISSDLIFTLQKTFSDAGKPFEASLTITFSNEGDGIQSTIAAPLGGSELRLPRYAPELHYESKLVKNTFRTAANQMIVPAARENLNYFFRVRTRKENGKIVSANYGKIDRDIDFDIINSDTALLFFIYYLNPTPNDRNMEFDPKHNLFSELPLSQRVIAP